MRSLEGEFSPGSIDQAHLNEVECCALAHGFTNNDKVVAALSAAVGGELIKTAANVLVNTKDIAFPRNEPIEAAYVQIAKAELGRLAAQPGLFHCNHSSEEHKKALEAVIQSLERPAN